MKPDSDMSSEFLVPFSPTNKQRPIFSTTPEGRLQSSLGLLTSPSEFLIRPPSPLQFPRLTPGLELPDTAYSPTGTLPTLFLYLLSQLLPLCLLRVQIRFRRSQNIFRSNQLDYDFTNITQLNLSPFLKHCIERIFIIVTI